MTTRFGVREEPSYEEARAKLGIEVKRLDEVLEGVVWAIARGADDETVCPEVLDGIRLIKAQLPGGTGSLRVWLVVEADSMQACLIWIDIDEPSAEEDESW